jgi:hypothetical protein
VLSACKGGRVKPAKRTGRSKVKARSVPVLSLLVGHEKTILAFIADFVGVTRGRALRNLQEAAIALSAMLLARS